jgi:cytochrome c biogenesis protein
MDTKPRDYVPPPTPPPGVVALARRSWRQLTSMRTALVLLFLLAVAAIPGSLLPQRNLNIERVGEYLAAHHTAGPWLDRLWLFDVYASPWFSAIYLLLFVSLVGCLVPRLRDHLVALFRVPPEAPRRLERLPAHADGIEHHGDPATVASGLQKLLKARRFRAVVRERDGDFTVNAEKGYLKETGNLLFHFALLGMLIGVASGSWWGWHANRLVVAGPENAFCDTLQQYDDYGLGARVSAGDLPPFCLRLDDFQASYLDNGQPTSYRALVHYTEGSGPERTRTVEVNDPLRLPGANVYLLGHGYAPVVRYTDRYGRSQTTTAPFLPSDGLLTSQGVAAFPDANVDPNTGTRDPKGQVAFAGVYLPTVSTVDPTRSAFPAERDPMLVLVAYVGDLGVDSGLPQSVYTLNQRQLDAGRLSKVGDPYRLRAGDSAKLPDGSTVEFLGTRPWATVSVRYDPGEKPVLVAAVCLLIGLLTSLTGKRRRVWFRIGPHTVTAGGLPRTEYAGFSHEFDEIVRAAADLPGPARVPARAPGSHDERSG